MRNTFPIKIMPSRKPGPPNRNILNHGAGKGDKCRSKIDDNYRANFDAILFPHTGDEGFVRREGRLTKRYGIAEPAKLEVEIL